MPEPLPQINPSATTYVTRRVFPADDWVLDEAGLSRAVVGKDSQCLWADGESLLVVGDTGHGKSTFTQNIVRAEIGLVPDILGMVVRQFANILYVAADRPKQIKASLRRMITETNRLVWHDKVWIHDGPLDFVLNEHPEKMAPFVKELAEHLDRPPFEVVVFDSLKDLVSEMDDNTAGIQINRAFQSLCRLGAQVAVDMHPRKMGSPKDKERPPTLDDVQGNKNITAGAGSVVYLGVSGEDGRSQLYHLKSPSGSVNGMWLSFEGATGNISYVDLG